ncbi:glycoprotein-N-acetylgalactosamine 3-beta-galactosyltransferase 1-B-like isoform X2 [Bacillus rossius redtenbacheri]|uniref:glycoprotein-N-acetylgalactosamine 3-beta-galactosyltransferase 1-B-like isoform X2 n=1 Tax=Bacillus rossius redtenbacheri TaxID=93214 RepID=UPI002FDD11FF
MCMLFSLRYLIKNSVNGSGTNLFYGSRHRPRVTGGNVPVGAGKRLSELGVVPRDTRDALGRGRFHGYNLNQLLFSGRMASLSDYYKKSVYPVPQGPECCSRHSATFHSSGADKIHLYDYLLYRLKVFARGGRRGNRPAPTPVPEEEVWRQFLREQGVGDADVSAQQFYELWKSEISSPDAFNEKLRREHLGSAPSGSGPGAAPRDDAPSDGTA